MKWYERPSTWILLGLAVVAALGAGTAKVLLTDRMRGARWENMLPETQAKALQLLEAARDAGLEVMFWDGWRSPAEAAGYIAAGTSKLKDPYNTAHLWGMAFDLVFRSAVGGPTWPPISDPRWKQLAELGEGLGLKSGLLMWGFDGPHFQLAEFDVAQLRERYGTNYRAFLQDQGVMIA